MPEGDAFGAKAGLSFSAAFGALKTGFPFLIGLEVEKTGCFESCTGWAEKAGLFLDSFVNPSFFAGAGDDGAVFFSGADDDGAGV